MRGLVKKIEPGIRCLNENDSSFFTACEGHTPGPSPYCPEASCSGCISFSRLTKGESLRSSGFCNKIEAQDFAQVVMGLGLPEALGLQVVELIKDWDGFSYGRGSMYGGTVAVARSFTKGELFTAGAPGYGSWSERFYQVG